MAAMSYQEMEAALANATLTSIAHAPAVTKSVSDAKGHELSVLIKTLTTATFVIDKLEQQVAELQNRVTELESSGLKYQGVHQASIAYRKGHVVTHDGAAWAATRDVSVEK